MSVATNFQMVTLFLSCSSNFDNGIWNCIKYEIQLTLSLFDLSASCLNLDLRFLKQEICNAVKVYVLVRHI